MLLLGIFLYTRWRSYKGLKEGVYHVSAHHDGWEDIRENVLNYDEEGGGEEDQVSAWLLFQNWFQITVQRIRCLLPTQEDKPALKVTMTTCTGCHASPSQRGTLVSLSLWQPLTFKNADDKWLCWAARESATFFLNVIFISRNLPNKRFGVFDVTACSSDLSEVCGCRYVAGSFMLISAIRKILLHDYQIHSGALILSIWWGFTHFLIM